MNAACTAFEISVNRLSAHRSSVPWTCWSSRVDYLKREEPQGSGWVQKVWKTKWTRTSNDRSVYIDLCKRGNDVARQLSINLKPSRFPPSTRRPTNLSQKANRVPSRGVSICWQRCELLQGDVSVIMGVGVDETGMERTELEGSSSRSGCASVWGSCYWLFGV